MKHITNNNIVISIAAALFLGLFLYPVKNAHALTGDVAPRGAPDGKFNLADYVVLQQFVLGKATPTAAEIVAADVAPAGNPDGIINLADIVVLQQAIMNDRLQSGMMICMPGSGCPQGAYLAGATFLQQSTDSQGNILSVVYFDSAKNPLTMQYDVNGNIIGSNLVPSYQAPSDSTGASSEVVGSLGGEFVVSPGGAATYSIPIEIPPGISGMQPQISIVYDSSAENGLLGMGFVLSAQSEITRCHKTLAVEGVVSGINYDATDAYCLDGQKLINIGGNEYITETGNTQKIVYSGNIFTVTSRSGSTAVYGAADSNILAQGKTVTRVWAVKSETDQYGNYVTYNYTQDGVNGDYRLASIQYTGTYNSSPAKSIEFIYEDRPDIFTGYVKGSKFSSLKRLSKIITKSNAATIFEYSFIYETANSTFRSRIAKLKKCAGAGGLNGCVKDTSFTWSNGDSTFATANDTNINNIGWDSNRKIIDVNGDGKSDLVLAYGGYWHIRFSTGNGFGPDVNTGITSPYAEYSQPIDYDGDGRMDVIFPADNVWKIMRSTGSNYELISSGASNEGYQNNVQIADVNGDGLSDLVFAAYGTWRVRLNTGGGFGGVLNSGISTVYWDYAQAVDINGDGKTEIIIPRENLWKTLQWNGTTLTLVPTTTPNYFYQNRPKYMDINGDGLPDMVYPYNYVWNIRLNTGGDFGPQVPTTLNTLYWDKAMEIDYNRDGRVDLIYPANYVWNILLSTGDNFTLKPTTINNVGWDNNPSVADVDGDGLSDMILAYNSHWIILPHNGKVEDYLINIDNGAGMARAITYKPLTDSSVYTKGTGATYPSQDIQFSKYVVAEQTTTDGLNGTVRTTYKYGNARVDMHGRGDLGFGWTESTNTQTGLVTYVTYRQDYPFIGMTAYEKQTLNGKVIQETINTPVSRNSYAGRPIAYVSPVTVINYDSNQTYLSTVTTTSTVNEYGDVESSTVSTTDGASTYNVITNNIYGLKGSSVWCEKGLPTQSSTYKSGPLGTAPTVVNNFIYNNKCGLYVESGAVAGQAGLTKTYGYDGYGHINSTTITGPDITTRVSTTLHDVINNKVTLTNEMGHTSSVINDPRFGVPLTQTDANGLTTTYVYNDFGELTDTYAPGGNRTQVTKQWCTQNCTIPAINGSVQAQIAKFTVTTRYFGGTGSAESYMPDTQVFYDKLGRSIRSRTTSFDNKVIYADTAYDSLGRVVASTQPYFSNETASKNPTTTKYDTLNRPYEITVAGEGTTTIAYNKFNTTTTRSVYNPATGLTSSQSNTEVKNFMGQLLEQTDNAGNKLYFECDAQGNQVRTLMPSLLATGAVINPKGNVITVGYDNFGRKTSMNDPNMGNWSYTYDSSSMMRTQTDALMQTTTMQYDRMGRMTKRTDHDGTVTNWVYNDDLQAGNTPAARAIGKLDTVYMTSGGGAELYRQKLTYTSTLGLPDQSTTTIDGISYSTNAGYDKFYRPETVTYPNTSTTATPKRLQLKYVYTNGTLSTVQKADGSINYWQVNYRDANGALRGTKLGNGVQQWRKYDEAGRLTWMNFGFNGDVYNANYQYDTLGNLVHRDTQRGYGTQKLDETYGYDTLNRLVNVNINGLTSQTMSYDVLGNIRSKIGVGTYEYAGTRPNAVTKANGVDYIYNANGALTSGGGKNVAWYSFNKPAIIYNAQVSSIFNYGPDRARYKHVANDLVNPANTVTTIYIGSSYEKVVKNGVTTHKHYIQAGGEAIAEYTIDNSGVEKTEYFHRDNQGSMVAVSNEAGHVTGQLDYDAFGKRRAVIGESVVQNIINTVPRGYTGHEHLDKLGLIHMNGRVYDPDLGRFLSADPFIQHAGNLQSYNRYSYVLNNPMSYTDPSGFMSKKWKKIAAAAIVISFPGTTASIAVMYSKPVRRVFMKYEWARVAGQIAAGVADGAGCNGGCSAAFSAYITDISGGSASDIFKAAAISYMSYQAFQSVDAKFKMPKGGSLSFADKSLKILAKGAVGGTMAELGGGKFRNGFAASAGVEFMRQLYTGTVDAYKEGSNNVVGGDSKALWSPATSGTAIKPQGVAIWDMQDNNIGTALTGNDNWLVRNITGESGIVSVTTNVIPGFNSFAAIHDIWGEYLKNTNSGFGGGGLWAPVTNYGSMPIALAVNYGALLGQTPVSVVSYQHNRRNNKYQ